jgi:hypothetical protein
VVIKKELNQLYNAVGTVIGLGITLKHTKRIEISSESDVSITYTGSLFNSDEIEDV